VRQQLRKPVSEIKFIEDGFGFLKKSSFHLGQLITAQAEYPKILNPFAVLQYIKFCDFIVIQINVVHVLVVRINPQWL
jgi:hypothetical protein